jgi:hypothetical protein
LSFKKGDKGKAYYPFWVTCKGEKQGVCHTVTLPFTLKSIILRQKKNYGNSNISPGQNIIFKNSSKRNHKSLQNFITQ